jgi:hypothetical protein
MSYGAYLVKRCQKNLADCIWMTDTNLVMRNPNEVA